MGRMWSKLGFQSQPYRMRVIVVQMVGPIIIVLQSQSGKFSRPKDQLRRKTKTLIAQGILAAALDAVAFTVGVFDA